MLERTKLKWTLASHQPLTAPTSNVLKTNSAAGVVLGAESRDCALPGNGEVVLAWRRFVLPQTERWVAASVSVVAGTLAFPFFVFGFPVAIQLEGVLRLLTRTRFVLALCLQYPLRGVYCAISAKQMGSSGSRGAGVGLVLLQTYRVQV
ncbi:hypothetical protein HJG60_008258 [Phyllostomus discolor]|uniref:Uncharacterized protein n=1 Tax=Phyllostomus discolor TaxID=89673 RepID=A0A833Z8U5_9CHIR|nr:hypothetical protein HJG60_008258 [Phyllostomus discolor]